MSRQVEEAKDLNLCWAWIVEKLLNNRDVSPCLLKELIVKIRSFNDSSFNSLQERMAARYLEDFLSKDRLQASAVPVLKTLLNSSNAGSDDALELLLRVSTEVVLGHVRETAANDGKDWEGFEEDLNNLFPEENLLPECIERRKELMDVLKEKNCTSVLGKYPFDALKHDLLNFVRMKKAHFSRSFLDQLVHDIYEAKIYLPSHELLQQYAFLLAGTSDVVKSPDKLSLSPKLRGSEIEKKDGTNDNFELDAGPEAACHDRVCGSVGILVQNLQKEPQQMNGHISSETGYKETTNAPANSKEKQPERRMESVTSDDEVDVSFRVKFRSKKSNTSQIDKENKGYSNKDDSLAKQDALMEDRLVTSNTFNTDERYTASLGQHDQLPEANASTQDRPKKLDNFDMDERGKDSFKNDELPELDELIQQKAFQGDRCLKCNKGGLLSTCNGCSFSMHNTCLQPQSTNEVAACPVCVYKSALAAYKVARKKAITSKDRLLAFWNTENLQVCRDTENSDDGSSSQLEGSKGTDLANGTNFGNNCVLDKKSKLIQKKEMRGAVQLQSSEKELPNQVRLKKRRKSHIQVAKQDPISDGKHLNQDYALRRRKSRIEYREAPDIPCGTLRRKKQPWTEAEVEAIMRGIEKYPVVKGKIPWKLIFEDGKDVFHGRRSHDLKDKWRNLQKAPS